MRPDIREQSLPRRTKTGVLAIGEGSIYGHSNDCSLTVPFAGASGDVQFGKFNSRSIAWKRGSLRNGSKTANTLRYCNHGS